MARARNLGRVVVGAVASRWGPVNIAVSEVGVVAVEIGAGVEGFRGYLARRGWDVLPDPAGTPQAQVTLLEAARAEIAEYVAGRRAAFDLPVDLAASSAWDRRVLEGVRQIPFGSTLGYGQLARLVDAPRAARAVGGAVGRNPVGLLIPCHRVIAGDGSIGGYGGSWAGERDANIALKRSLLAHEGVLI
jgi:methylated-DNA-[protein]-cysteine S-methyltransferase